MKIITWNINSVRLRIELLKKLADEYSPDIISLQETKVEDHLFPHEAIKDMGYDHLYYSGQKSYNGVAILSKIPFESKFSLDLYNNDKRHVAVSIKIDSKVDAEEQLIEIHNFYVPSGGDIPSIRENPKFKHKLEYIALMEEWLTMHRAKNDKLILLGDLNIAPHEHDVWSSKQLRNDVSHTDIERSSLIKLQNSLNFVDSARHFLLPNEKLYTWWSYRSLDWQKSNRGLRIDHIWVSQNLQPNMVSMKSISEMRSSQRPSDHAPYLLELGI